MTVADRPVGVEEAPQLAGHVRAAKIGGEGQLSTGDGLFGVPLGQIGPPQQVGSAQGRAGTEDEQNAVVRTLLGGGVSKRSFMENSASGRKNGSASGPGTQSRSTAFADQSRRMSSTATSVPRDRRAAARPSVAVGQSRAAGPSSASTVGAVGTSATAAAQPVTTVPPVAE